MAHPRIMKSGYRECPPIARTLGIGERDIPQNPYSEDLLRAADERRGEETEGDGECRETGRAVPHSSTPFCPFASAADAPDLAR